MTDKITGVKKPVTIDQQQLAQELVEQARAEGVELVGAGGLLTGLTKTVLETALEAEISDHLGYDRHDSSGRNGDNSRNGHRSKTVLTGSARSTSTCHATGTAASNRRSCASGSGGWTRSTRSSCR
jgi:hypothetical protein